MKNNKKSKEINKEISSTAIIGEPETVFDMINKYGTYEIQPTADTDNKFPTIAQGFSRKEQERERLDEKGGEK